jgi:hypothetical protein
MGDFAMTRRAVAILLCLHAAVVWLAVPFRVDEFPLTWAPMYAVQPKPEHGVWSVVLKDRERLDREGWRGERADGGEEWIRRADLNVPTRNRWRLYFERTWLKGSPRYKHKNSGEWTLDRWLLGIPPGAPIFSEDWERRLLTSVNATLGRRPGEPQFLVALRAERGRMHFDSRTFERRADTRERAEVRWRSEWDAEFPQ